MIFFKYIMLLNLVCYNLSLNAKVKESCIKSTQENPIDFLLQSNLLFGIDIYILILTYSKV